MTDYDIGYGKTDPKTRWKKGQCGNPRKKRPLKIPTMASMVDDIFTKVVSARKRGAQQRLTGFEVILLRLLPEIGNGKKKAIRIWKKYQAYAQAHPTIIKVAKEEADSAASAAWFRELAQNLEPKTKEEAEYDEAFRRLTAVEAAEEYRQLIHSQNEK
jgi:hypothetical protein